MAKNNPKKLENPEIISQISSHLNQLLIIIKDFLYSFNIRITKSFSSVFALFILLLYLSFKKEHIYSTTLSFGLLAILIFLTDNKYLSFFANKIKQKFPRIFKKIRVKNFLEEIESKNFGEVVDFLYKYKYYLKPEEIKKIIDSKHTANITIFKYIVFTQLVKQELIKLLVDNRNILSKIKPEVMNKFIMDCDTHLDMDSIHKINNNYSDNKLVLSALYLRNPDYIKESNLNSKIIKFLNKLQRVYNLYIFQVIIGIILVFVSLDVIFGITYIEGISNFQAVYVLPFIISVIIFSITLKIGICLLDIAVLFLTSKIFKKCTLISNGSNN